jgi:two-component system chemotaxis response regulator CheY
MKHILVIDDSAVARSFHASILKSAGFTADGATDGMDALEKATLQQYDLMLCDINMPKMDGLTFIRRLRDTGQDVPVIIISTQEEAAHRRQGFMAGANLYLVKPAKPSQLVMHVNLLLGPASAPRVKEHAS